MRHARFSRIRFAAEYSRVDENGVHHPGEWPTHYREMYVKNADGIDLRIGCSDIVIEDISGFTGDDTVALTALGGFERKLGLFPAGLSPDIHDVTVRHVDSETFCCATVRLLNHNGNKLYNVTVEDITNRHTEGIHRSHAAVSIGDKNYAERLNAPGDTHRITVRNVRSAAAEEGVEYTKTIRATKGRASYLGDRSIGHQDPGATSATLTLKAVRDYLKA